MTRTMFWALKKSGKKAVYGHPKLWILDFVQLQGNPAVESPKEQLYEQLNDG